MPRGRSSTVTQKKTKPKRTRSASISGRDRGGSAGDALKSRNFDDEDEEEQTEPIAPPKKVKKKKKKKSEAVRKARPKTPGIDQSRSRKLSDSLILQSSEERVRDLKPLRRTSETRSSSSTSTRTLKKRVKASGKGAVSSSSAKKSGTPTVTRMGSGTTTSFMKHSRSKKLSGATHGRKGSIKPAGHISHPSGSGLSSMTTKLAAERIQLEKKLAKSKLQLTSLKRDHQVLMSTNTKRRKAVVKINNDLMKQVFKRKESQSQMYTEMTTKMERLESRLKKKLDDLADKSKKRDETNELLDDYLAALVGTLKRIQELTQQAKQQKQEAADRLRKQKDDLRRKSTDVSSGVGSTTRRIVVDVSVTHQGSNQTTDSDLNEDGKSTASSETGSLHGYYYRSIDRPTIPDGSGRLSKTHHTLGGKSGGIGSGIMSLNGTQIAGGSTSPGSILPISLSNQQRLQRHSREMRKKHRRKVSLQEARVREEKKLLKDRRKKRAKLSSIKTSVEHSVAMLSAVDSSLSLKRSAVQWMDHEIEALLKRKESLQSLVKIRSAVAPKHTRSAEIGGVGSRYMSSEIMVSDEEEEKSASLPTSSMMLRSFYSADSHLGSAVPSALSDTISSTVTGLTTIGGGVSPVALPAGMLPTDEAAVRAERDSIIKQTGILEERLKSWTMKINVYESEQKERRIQIEQLERDRNDVLQQLKDLTDRCRKLRGSTDTSEPRR